MYFCCLEALQNMVEYAAASQIAVRLTQKNGTFAFEVSDDGRGFDPNTAHRAAGSKAWPIASRRSEGRSLLWRPAREPAPPVRG